MWHFYLDPLFKPHLFSHQNLSKVHLLLSLPYPQFVGASCPQPRQCSTPPPPFQASFPRACPACSEHASEAAQGSLAAGSSLLSACSVPLASQSLQLQPFMPSVLLTPHSALPGLRQVDPVMLTCPAPAGNLILGSSLPEPKPAPLQQLRVLLDHHMNHTPRLVYISSTVHTPATLDSQSLWFPLYHCSSPLLLMSSPSYKPFPFVPSSCKESSSNTFPMELYQTLSTVDLVRFSPRTRRLSLMTSNFLRLHESLKHHRPYTNFTK